MHRYLCISACSFLLPLHVFSVPPEDKAEKTPMPAEATAESEKKKPGHEGSAEFSIFTVGLVYHKLLTDSWSIGAGAGIGLGLHFLTYVPNLSSRERIAFVENYQFNLAIAFRISQKWRIETGFRHAIEDGQFLGCHSCLGKDKHFPAAAFSILFGDADGKIGMTFLFGNFPVETRSEYIGLTSVNTDSPANRFGISVLPIVRIIQYF